MADGEGVTRDEGAEIDLGVYWAVLRRGWWKIGLFSLVVGVASILVVREMPNYYQATAVITPPAEESKINPAAGALASIGLPVGNASKIEDLDALFRSRDVTARVFSKHDVWPIVLGERYDPGTGTLRPGWRERLMARFSDDAQAGRARKPGDWQAIRASNRALKLTPNKKAGTLSISFESLTAEGSARIVGFYLEEAKSRLQEEALERAVRNKRFIEEQIARTFDPLVRDRFYTLYGQEAEREMMARNREQFGFKILDSVRAPDMKSRPARARIVLSTTSAAAVFGYVVLFARRKRECRAG
ncbi:MAG TPA: Wzz/FepE/Etk N-terminal domain-containing protein [Candidatus Deferrimicrobiaceae bacterium]|jgi:uncharacterized protein involved in exopolysaccharide biosynthesis